MKCAFQVRPPAGGDVRRQRGPVAGAPARGQRCWQRHRSGQVTDVPYCSDLTLLDCQTPPDVCPSVEGLDDCPFRKLFRDFSCACSIRQALEVTLGTEPAGVEEEESLGDLGERSWAQLGGDSLAAIQFARRISEACGVNLPVSYVLDKSRTLGAIATHVQSLVRCVLFYHILPALAHL